MSLSRYTYLKFDGRIVDMPKIIISSRSTDKFVTYNPISTRIDRISGNFYGNDSYGWLIMMANPEYFMEFDIPRNTVIRVPFPYKDAEDEVISKILELKNK